MGTRGIINKKISSVPLSQLTKLLVLDVIDDDRLSEGVSTRGNTQRSTTYSFGTTGPALRPLYF